MKHGTHVVRFMVWNNDNFGAFKSKKNFEREFFCVVPTQNPSERKL